MMAMFPQTHLTWKPYFLGTYYRTSVSLHFLWGKSTVYNVLLLFELAMGFGYYKTRFFHLSKEDNNVLRSQRVVVGVKLYNIHARTLKSEKS